MFGMVMWGWLLALVINHSPVSAQPPCSLTIGRQTSTIDGKTNAAAILPGDTICLEPGRRSLLIIKHLHGTKEVPVIITNRTGEVLIVNSPNYGIKFDSCSYVVLAGNGHAQHKYGIRIDSVVGAGISVDGLSTNIEISHCEISNAGLVGIFAKTEPNCSFTSTRDKFTLRNLRIHDTFIHDTGMEGMYLGSAFFLGQTISCDGHDTLLYPHLLRGVEVYNNLVIRTALDAIQVSSADSGCNIHDNYILEDSYKGILYQMAGIFIGGGSACDCYNNVVKDGKGDGIDVFGLGGQRIYNNLIIIPGRSYMPEKNFSPYLKHGIYVGETYTYPGYAYIIVNNTIIAPKSYGVHFDNDASRGNVISNNIIVDPGSYTTIGDKAYVRVTDISMDVHVSNNLQTRDINAVRFIDPANHNFDLQPASPGVNLAAGQEWLAFDIMNRNRPFASFNDIGAYECHDTSLIGINEPGNNDFGSVSLSPNPSHERLRVALTVNAKSKLRISVRDLQGKQALKPVDWNWSPGDHLSWIDLSSLAPGIYLLVITTDRTVSTQKFIHLP
jgi:hypothetical protein